MHVRPLTDISGREEAMTEFALHRAALAEGYNFMPPPSPRNSPLTRPTRTAVSPILLETYRERKNQALLGLTEV